MNQKKETRNDVLFTDCDTNFFLFSSAKIRQFVPVLHSLLFGRQYIAGRGDKGWTKKNDEINFFCLGLPWIPSTMQTNFRDIAWCLHHFAVLLHSSGSQILRLVPRLNLRQRCLWGVYPYFFYRKVIYKSWNFSLWPH